LNAPLDFPGGPANLNDIAPVWAAAYQNNQPIPPVLGAHCGACQYKADPGDTLQSGFHACWKQANHWTDADFEHGTVLDLWNFRKKQALIEQGVLKISQVQREDLGDFEDDPEVTGLSRAQRQWQQINGIHPDYDHGGFYFDAALFQHDLYSSKRFAARVRQFDAICGSAAKVMRALRSIRSLNSVC